MRFKYFSLIAVVAALAACSKPDPTPTPGPDPVNPDNGGSTTTPTAPVSLTITATNPFGWSKADKVSIFDGKSNNLFRSQGAGESASLTGEALQVKPLYGFAPYDETASLAGSTVKATVAAKQTITADKTAGYVAGVAEDGQNMSFSAVTGFVQVGIGTDVPGMTAISVSAKGGEAIAGAVEVSFSGKTASVKAASQTSNIDVTAAEETFKLGAAYNVAVLPGTYAEGFSVFYTFNGETYELASEGPVTVEAGKTVEVGTITRPLTANERMFVGEWEVSKWGSRDPEDPTLSYAWISSDRGFGLPEAAKGDVITFNADGTVKIDLGPDGKAFHEPAGEGVNVELTGDETWALEETADGTILKLSGNAFPLFLGNWEGLTTDYRVFSLNPSQIVLEYDRVTEDGPGCFMIFLQPKGVKTFTHSIQFGDFGLPADTEIGEPMVQDHTAPIVQDGISWDLKWGAGVESFTWQAWGGVPAIRFGTGWSADETQHMTSLKLFTNDIKGKIKSVSVKTSNSVAEDGNGGEVVEVSVTVGGKTFGSKKTSTNDSTIYVFADAGDFSGEVSINWETKSGAVSYYLWSFEVVYQQ